MVGRSYMTAARSRPSAAKRYLDQVLIPAAIDVAGEVECGLQGVGRAVRQRPVMMLAGGVLLGAALGRLLLATCCRRR